VAGNLGRFGCGSSLFSVEYCGRRGGSQWLAGRIHVRIRFWKATARRFGNLRAEARLANRRLGNLRDDDWPG
jgi:hypothetical protein